MNCDTNIINQLSPDYDGIREQNNLDELHKMDREVEDIKSKLLQCHIKCERTEMLIYDVNQLKDKGVFVLENVKRGYSGLDEDLKEIHYNYVKCLKKVTSDGVIDCKVNSLTHQRDNLKKELQELKDLADENSKKLMEIKKVVMVQEKKNMALAKKLKKMVKNVRMAPNLKDRINTILNDPIITNGKITKQPTD